MSEIADVFRIPQFLEARTKQRLVRAMLLNNLKHSMEFNYFGIQKDNGKWIVWYRWPVDRSNIINEAIKRG